MTTRSLLGRRDPQRRSQGAVEGTEFEVLTRRFSTDVRREVRRLMRLSPRVVDLAVIFPGALYTIASSQLPASRRAAALEQVLTGQPLKSVAATLALPLWLRRLPPEAFSGPLPALPNSETFTRRIVNALPTSRSEAALWLAAVAFAAEATHEDFAVWLAHQPIFAPGPGSDPARLFGVLAAYAWFSGKSHQPARQLMIVPWRPEISFETALCAAKSWLNRVRLTLQLYPGVIDDGWLEPGEAMGLSFVPLLTADELLLEAQLMHNCADQYSDRIARDRCRLWSIRRRNGQRLATLEIGQHPREPGVLAAVQLKARHNLPAPLEVWQATHAWMAGQHGLRRAPPMVQPSRQPDTAGWAALTEPYRQEKGGAPWLPQNLTLAALTALDGDMADLSRRAGISSWLFT
jgi:hypothetical protein